MRIFGKMLCLVLLVGLALPAMADGPLVVVLNVPNSGLSGTPGPYATVTVTLTGSTINISVSNQPDAGGNFTYFGQGQGNDGIFGFNVVGSTAGLTITNFASTGPGANSNLSWLGGGGTMDGFGTFEVTIQDGNPPNSHGSFSFDVNRTGGFSSVNNVFEASSTGAHFVAHVAPTNGNPTGFAGDSGTPIPEPGSLVLLGSGLVGLAGFIRRRLR